jgi:hypothetical protein
MTAIPFDVFAFTHSLVDSGIPNNQADTIAQAFSKAIQESNATVIEQTKITIEHFKSEYKLDDVVTNKSLDARILETELKIEQVKNEIKNSEIRVITQLSAMQQDIQLTKMTNKALLALCTVIAGALIKIAFFTTH